MSELEQIGPRTWHCRTHNLFFPDGENCPRCAVKPLDRARQIQLLRDANMSQREIARRLGITQMQVWRTIERTNRGPTQERFHALRIKFSASIDYDALALPETRMKNTVYKTHPGRDMFAQIFKRSVLVIFRKEKNIYDLKAQVAMDHALDLVREFITTLPAQVHVLADVREVVARHNAFVNDMIARRFYQDQGRNIHVKVAGQERLISDASNGPIELEAVHKDHAVADSTRIECLYEDLITKPSDLPSVVNGKINVLEKNINFVVDVMGKYAYQMDKHLAVEERTLQNLNAQTPLFEKMTSTLQEISIAISKTRRRQDVRQVARRGMTSPSVARARRERAA